MGHRFLRNFAKDESGGVLIYTAFSAAVMLGFVGLSMDVGYWYHNKRDMQSAADAAAMAAVLELARGATPGEIETRAMATAALNGYSGMDVLINNPPASGPYEGNPNFIEAVVSQNQPGFISGIVYSGDMPIMARAVGTLAGAPACVLALNPTASGALAIQGNTDVTLNCGAQSNSTADPSIDQTGNSATMTAYSIQSSGTSDCGGCSPAPTDGMPQAYDPFAYLTQPAMPGSCLFTAKLKVTSSTTLEPGHYCGGLEITGGTVTFNEGVYILDGVGLKTSGNPHLQSDPAGDGQTFYFPDTVTGQANRALFIAGTVSTDLVAPTQGPYDGVLFYLDPGINPNLDVKLTGGSDMALTGVIYGPNSHVEYSGNANGADTWTSIVADTVTFTGNSTLSSAGFVGGNLPLALSSPSLVE